MFDPCLSARLKYTFFQGLLLVAKGKIRCQGYYSTHNLSQLLRIILHGALGINSYKKYLEFIIWKSFYVK